MLWLSASGVNATPVPAGSLPLSERVVDFVAEIPGSVFSTVRQRVARHLLDLASEQRRDDRLIAHVSQQRLAEAVGSVREVVVRVRAKR